MVIRQQSPFTIRCEGALTLSAAPKLRDEILSALQTHRVIVADVSAATEVDLTFIQILVSAKVTARAFGGSFAVNGREDSVVLSKLKCAGDPSGSIVRDGGQHEERSHG